jgi:hypothetical protein
MMWLRVKLRSWRGTLVKGLSGSQLKTLLWGCRNNPSYLNEANSVELSGENPIVQKRWTKPRIGFLKVNVDASFREETMSLVIGTV